jgi:hypothetical protein
MIFQPPHEDLASNIGAIYKYSEIICPEHLNRALTMIREGTLWFWHVTRQNDENECKPKVFFGEDRRARYKYFLEDFKQAYPQVDTKILKEKAKQAARNPKIPSPDMIYNYWAICCFSAKGNCPHLWRRYAGNGKGIVLEYEAKEGSSIGMAAKVKYTDNPVFLDILQIDEEKCYEIFTTKITKWDIEQEYRMVEKLRVPNSGKNFTYSDIRILSVRLGSVLNKNFRKEIIDLCQNMKIAIHES